MAEVDRVNPVTGQDGLPAQGCAPRMLGRGRTARPPLRSCLQAFREVKGQGRPMIGSRAIDRRATGGAQGYLPAAPLAEIDHLALDESVMIRVHDTPLKDNLDYDEERAR